MLRPATLKDIKDVASGDRELCFCDAAPDTHIHLPNRPAAIAIRIVTEERVKELSSKLDEKVASAAVSAVTRTDKARAVAVAEVAAVAEAQIANAKE